mmetsp:Transcript_118752/g.206811  ORF Transcript_118752/g.206811 Transcript_118752/m.206811 type:complete len:299 (+) Transcript_118752:1288-2184(+)
MNHILMNLNLDLSGDLDHLLDVSGIGHLARHLHDSLEGHLHDPLHDAFHGHRDLHDFRDHPLVRHLNRRCVGLLHDLLHHHIVGDIDNPFHHLLDVVLLILCDDAVHGVGDLHPARHVPRDVHLHLPRHHPLHGDDDTALHLVGHLHHLLHDPLHRVRHPPLPDDLPVVLDLDFPRHLDHPLVHLRGAGDLHHPLVRDIHHLLHRVGLGHLHCNLLVDLAGDQAVDGLGHLPDHLLAHGHLVRDLHGDLRDDLALHWHLDAAVHDGDLHELRFMLSAHNRLQLSDCTFICPAFICPAN